MGRTALELTPEELQSYRPLDDERMNTEIQHRREQAWATARRLAQLLKDDFGAKQVILFGSLAKGRFRLESDIDLAARGIPDERYYSAVAAVTRFDRRFAVDLVDPQDCRPSVLRSIEEDGIQL